MTQMVDAPAPDTSESAPALETVETNSPPSNLADAMAAARAAAQASASDDGSTVPTGDSTGSEEQPSEQSSADPTATGRTESTADGRDDGATGTDPSADSGQPKLSRKDFARQRDGQQEPAADQGDDTQSEVERRAQELYQQHLQSEQTALERQRQQQEAAEQHQERKSKARGLLLDPVTKKDLTERSARFELSSEEGDRLAKGLEMEDFYDLMIDDSRVDALAAISADLGQEASKIGIDPVKFGANRSVADVVRFLVNHGTDGAQPRIAELETTLSQRDQRIAALEAELVEARHGAPGTAPATELGGTSPQGRPLTGRLSALLDPVTGLPSDEAERKARRGDLTNYFNQP